MSFQNNIAMRQGFGVVGEIFTDSPRRSEVLTLQSADAADNIIGRAFTLVSEGFVEAGGAGSFAGILINPKHYASQGGVSGTLSPSLQLLNNAQGEFLYMGEIIVSLGNAAAIGDAVCFDDATGELFAGAPAAGQTAVPNAVVSRYATAGAGLAVIRLTN